MNSDRHLELYYGISGNGAMCNTINPRLAPDDIAYIAAHAEDWLIFADPAFLPLVTAIAPNLKDTMRDIVLLAAPSETPVEPLDWGMPLFFYGTPMEHASELAESPAFDEEVARRCAHGRNDRPAEGHSVFAPLGRVVRDDDGLGRCIHRQRRKPCRRSLKATSRARLAFH